jgi:hypothetical protein
MAASAGVSATATATETTVPDSDHQHHSVTVHGDDDTTPVTAPGGTYDDEFCNTWIVIEQAFAHTPEDPAELSAWYAETAAPLFAAAREYAPEMITEPVNAYMDAVEAFGTIGDFNVLSQTNTATPRRRSTRLSRRAAGYRSSRYR